MRSRDRLAASGLPWSSRATHSSDLGTMKQSFSHAGFTVTDMNGDGQTNFADLGLLKAGFFLPPGPSGVPNNCGAG